MGPDEFNVPDLYVDLRDLAGVPFYLKCEGFNFAGSVKLKAAISMVDAAVRSAPGAPGGALRES
jgi:cysteine synthase A